MYWAIVYLFPFHDHITGIVEQESPPTDLPTWRHQAFPSPSPDPTLVYFNSMLQEVLFTPPQPYEGAVWNNNLASWQAPKSLLNHSVLPLIYDHIKTNVSEVTADTFMMLIADDANDMTEKGVWLSKLIANLDNVPN